MCCRTLLTLCCPELKSLRRLRAAPVSAADVAKVGTCLLSSCQVRSADASQLQAAQ